MELLLELLVISERMRADWVILPATMALYNKRTVNIVDAASEWKEQETTILVCTKGRGNGTDRYAFVSSSGDAFDQYKGKIGHVFSASHDQTGASKGDYRLKNVVVLKDGEIKKKVNDEGTDPKVKASLSVFK